MFFQAEGQSESEAEAERLAWTLTIAGGTATIPLVQAGTLWTLRYKPAG